MTPVSDIDREARWELQGVHEGIARYRRAAASRDPSSLPEAQLVLRECAGRLAEAIRKDQDAATGFIAGEGKPPPWGVPIMLFDAEALAVMAVMHAFGTGERPGTQPEGRVTLTSRAVRLARMMQDQLRFDTYASDGTRATETRPLRKVGAKFPNLNKRDWQRIKKRVAIAKTCEWSDHTAVVLGAMLLQRLCETCPEWFRMGLRAHSRSGSGTYTLMLTDRAWELVSDAKAHAEVACPVFMPMIIPPNPWEYVE